MSLLAFLELRYPVRTLPSLLFDIASKVLWIAVIAIVSIPTLSLYGPMRNDPNYVPKPAHRPRAITKCCWIAAFGGKLTSLA
jgi:hypothetical protein